MKNSAKKGIVLAVFLIAVTVFAFWWRSPANWPGNTSAGQPLDQAADTVSPETAASTGDPTTRDAAPEDTRPHNGTGALARNQASNAERPAEFRNATAPAMQTAFEAEERMLGPGGRGIDFETSAAVMTGTSFESYMDALATQASREPLAAELTELYRNSATDDARSVEGASVQRVVCGLKICFLSGTATSDEAVRQWHVRFGSNAAATPLDSMLRNVHHLDGRLEFRMVFATDPASVVIVQPPPNAGRP